MKHISPMAETQYQTISCKPVRVRFEMDPTRIHRPNVCALTCIM